MVFLLGACPLSAIGQTTSIPVVDLIRYSEQKTRATLTEIGFDPTKHPDITDPDTGHWITKKRSEWTSGFFPGTLWLLYRNTGDEFWKEQAVAWTKDLKNQKDNDGDHDTGFRIMSSYGNGYSITFREEYRQVILDAAATLATRYDPRIKAIKSWDWTGNYPVIIDNMMNLELLFWAARNGGEGEWYRMATNHADKTIENHLRQDGSTYHIVDYNDDGTVGKKHTLQGYGPESTWSRGQAWAIYGFTMTYRFTHEDRFLEAARKTARFFIDHLPADYIPFYDFEDPRIPDVNKDASAAAVAASGLLELYEFTGRNEYLETAENILHQLSTDEYRSINSSHSSLLYRSTRHKGDPERGVIYADYYYLEALTRLKRLRNRSFPVIESETSLRVKKNYPNPFSGSTVIPFSVNRTSRVRIRVYDLLGREVKTLLDATRSPGDYSVTFRAGELQTGVYFYQIRTGDDVATRKFILMN